MSVTLFHNPRCSKSRQALSLLEEKGIDLTITLYLETPPSVEDLRAILGKLGIGPRDILRKKEAAEYGLNDPTLDDDALIAGLCANPRAIERPIAIKGDKAVIYSYSFTQQTLIFLMSQIRRHK